MSFLRDNAKEVDINLRSNSLVINLLDEAVVADYVDMDMLKLVVEEFEIFERDTAEHPPLFPIIIEYKGSPMAEVYPDGSKKFHPITTAHLGLKVLIHKLVKSL